MQYHLFPRDGGGASDRHITENCGLYKLLPGDVVLADRGFDIKYSEGMMCAEVKVPGFTKGRRQLDAKDVKNTRAIAHLRVTGSTQCYIREYQLICYCHVRVKR